MGLTAQFRLSSPTLPLVDVAAAVPDTRLALEGTRPRDADRPVTFLRAVGRSVEALERAFEHDSFVVSYALVSEEPGSRLYRIVGDGGPDYDLDELTSRKAVFDGPRITPSGWLVTGEFSDREELVALREFFLDNGVDFTLERLSASDYEPLDLLTARQSEALVTARELGYFDIPRRASTDEVADHLGIAASSLSERLRRAQGHLVDHYFDAEYIKPRTD
jgi:predicted DNA binding protein